MKFKIYLAVLFAVTLIGSAFADEKAKVVFISGTPSHGLMKHEHRAGNMILADALNKSGLDVEGVLVPHYTRKTHHSGGRGNDRDLLHWPSRSCPQCAPGRV